MTKPRTIALEALTHYPLRVQRLSLLFDGYNVTYEVRDETGGRYALRIGRPVQIPAEVEGEVVWCEALARDTGVRLLNFVRSKDGAPVVLSHGRCCVLSTWVHGVKRGKGLSNNMLEAVGRTMALMHRHARAWDPPTGWHRETMDGVWLAGDPDPIDNLPAEYQSVFRASHDKLLPLIRGLVADEAIILHADLHQGNYRFAKGHDVGVIDFDDCALGHPVQDIGITFYYLQRFPNHPELQRAFERGYAALEPWPLTPALLDALLVWRAMGLLAAVTSHETAWLRAYGEKLLPGWAARCEAWLG